MEQRLTLPPTTSNADMNIGIYNNSSDEVIRVNALFFQKPYNKQRAVLRLFIWWAVKHYFKIIFK